MAFLTGKGANILATAIRNLKNTVTGLDSKVTNIEGTANSAKTTAENAIPKVSGSVDGNIPVLNASGELADGGTNITTITKAISDAESNANSHADAALSTHATNNNNPHNVTKEQVGLSNVENKSSETIRSELTKENVTTALGYTPPTQDTVYQLPVATAGTLGGVKSGTDITIDETGNVTVVDNSHNHTIANVSGLSDALSTKASIDSVSTVQEDIIEVSDIADNALSVAQAAIPKVAGATDGNIPVLNASGQLVDGGSSISELKSSISTAESNAKSYTDTKLSDLINGAPEALDTLGEIATALAENEEVVDVLQDAIGTKANLSDLTSHTGNTSNPHNVTKAQIGLSDVENKSSETIRSELTKENVTNALGYTPPAKDTVYVLPAATETQLGGVKSGTDITIDGMGNVSVNDNSHNHTIANVTGLETALNEKAATSDLTAHTGNTNNPHNVTKAQIGLGYVENKSSETIRSELTKENVTTALGYTPPTQDTVYTLPTATNGVLGGVKSGTGITVDESGNVTINDNSHNHTIANVTGLQDALNSKATTTQLESVQNTANAAIPKLLGAVAGNVAIVNTDGTISDGGIKLSVVDGGLRITYDDGN